MWSRFPRGYQPGRRASPGGPMGGTSPDRHGNQIGLLRPLSACQPGQWGRAARLRGAILVASSLPSSSRLYFIRIVNVAVYNVARTEPAMYTAPSLSDEPTTYRLERPLDELVPAPEVARMRRLRLALMGGGAIGLMPWIRFFVI